MLSLSTCFVGLVDPVHCETSQGNNLTPGVKKGSDNYKLLQQGWEFGFKEQYDIEWKYSQGIVFTKFLYTVFPYL